jgi:chemotaxis protein MotB
MRAIEASILAATVLAFGGTAGAVDWTAICCDGGYEYRHPSAWEKEQQRLREAMAAGDTGKSAAELAAANRRIADLERQVADREREMAALRAEQSAELEKLKVAERGVVKGLRPQIEKGDITVDANSERLLINLSSAYLFGSGEDAVKPEGAAALKHVGSVLKDFPQYKVEVAGHTDNVPIHGALTARFPTNKELSEARAVSAAKALADGGRTDAVTTGYGETKPIESNSSAEGRAKNRRVEVRVTR